MRPLAGAVLRPGEAKSPSSAHCGNRSLPADVPTWESPGQDISKDAPRYIPGTSQHLLLQSSPSAATAPIATGSVSASAEAALRIKTLESTAGGDQSGSGVLSRPLYKHRRSSLVAPLLRSLPHSLPDWDGAQTSRLKGTLQDRSSSLFCFSVHREINMKGTNVLWIAEG